MSDKHTEEIGKMAASLSIIEIGLGSLLHSFKIPFSGHFLSLNQSAFLTRLSFKQKEARSALSVSIITALLKSLSPSGKKLTPMLAIAAQGFLYFFGLFFFGVNYLGLFLSIMLTSLWGFLQPVLFIYILFGKSSIDVAEHFIKEFSKIIPHSEDIILWILLSAILLKIIIGYALSIVILKMNDSTFEKYQKALIKENKIKKSTTEKSPFYLALRDLFNPFFIFSFALTLFFFIFSQSSASQLIWALLRPLAIGYIIFFIVRVYPIENFSLKLSKWGFVKLSEALSIAIKNIKEFKS